MRLTASECVALTQYVEETIGDMTGHIVRDLDLTIQDCEESNRNKATNEK